MHNTNRAEAFIAGLGDREIMSYLTYWRELIPHTPRDVWLRWVFAFMSIHTSWQNNVKGYLAIKALPAPFDKSSLAQAIASAGVGLNTNRLRGIWEFTQLYQQHPWWFVPRPAETMAHMRDRFADGLFGIGMAKTSFVLEMQYPVTCGVVCLDTHILQLYEVSRDTPGKDQYHDIEGHWCECCRKRGVSAPLARHRYWDKLQQQDDTRYWAWCLENNDGLPDKAASRGS